MTKRRKTRLPRIEQGLWLLLLPALAWSAAPEPERARLEKAIQELESAQAGRAQARDRLTAELAALDRRIGDLARRLRDLEATRKALDARLQTLSEARAEEAKRIGRLRAELGALVRAAYLAGREERLKLLLNQEDPLRLQRMLAYHDYLAAARVRKLRELESHLERLAELERETETERRRQQTLAHRLEEEKAALEKEKRAQQDLVRRLEGELEQGDRRLRRLQEDARRLDRLVAEAVRDPEALAVPEHKPFGGRRGRLPWPLKGRLANAFGAEKIGNLRWEGVIIRAPEGREVKAVHGGRVAYADWLRGYGLLLIIDHGDGYMTLYGHNQGLFKEVGDWVREGEVIGLAGRSGGLGEPGIYFGIRRHGKPVDPVLWCRRRSRRGTG